MKSILLKRILVLWIVVLTLFSFTGCKKEVAEDAPTIPNNVYVADVAGILENDDKIYIEELCRMFDKKHNSAIKILIVKYASNRPIGSKPITEEETERYLFSVFDRTFKDALNRENNAVFFISTKERMVGIRLGKRLQNALTELKKIQIVENTTIPHFSKSDYANGIRLTVEEMIKGVDPNMVIPDKEVVLAEARKNKKFFNSEKTLHYIFVFFVSAVASMFLPVKGLLALGIICVFCCFASIFLGSFVLYEDFSSLSTCAILGILGISLIRFFPGRKEEPKEKDIEKKDIEKKGRL